MSEINDFDLLASCLAGDCGSYAKEWADRECRSLFDKIRSEITNLSFQITSQELKNGEEHWSASLNENSVRKWTEQERCFIHALPLSLFNGTHVREIFDLVASMDGHLYREFSRLRPTAVEKKINIYSTMFEEIYHKWSGTEISMGMVLKNFISGGWGLDKIKPSSLLLEFCKDMLARGSQTNGQLFLLLHVVQRFQWSFREWNDIIAPYLPNFLSEQQWKSFPYQVRMSLLDEAHNSWGASQEIKDQIIEQLNSLLENSRGNWMISTAVFDALQALGGLEKDEIEYEATVRNELASILKGKETVKKCEDAYSVHIKSFDHPYQNAYWAVINELNNEELKKLYTRALKGGIDKSSFGVPLALYYVAKFEDPTTADAIRPFTKIPAFDDTMPQSGTEACLLAHVALGWLGVPIISQLNSNLNNAAKAFLAYAEIMYWLNRRDLSQGEKTKGMSKPWKILQNHKLGVSVDVLRNFADITKESMTHFAQDRDVIVSLQQAFPGEAAEIYRQGLINPEIQSGYYRHERLDDTLTHAIHGLGYYGNQTDLPLLKKYTAHPVFGSSALSAIEEIESRHQV